MYSLTSGSDQGRGQAVRELVLQLQDEKFTGYIAQANGALGFPEYPETTMLMERTGLSSEAASRLMSYEFLWWDFRFQTIPFADELAPMERVGFDSFIRASYGLPGCSRFVYENVLKQMAHPDAVRYIDSLLAQPS